jgi:hypothetical protein
VCTDAPDLNRDLCAGNFLTVGMRWLSYDRQDAPAHNGHHSAAAAAKQF